ncbi:MAG: hypothetical protein ACPGUD_05765 [Parashewanella sp.]
MRWLLGLLFYSSIAVAYGNLFATLTSRPFQDPMDAIRLVEKTQPGVISSFNTEVQQGDIYYIFYVVNQRDNTCVQLEYAALTGKLIQQNVSILNSSQHPELAAIKFISKNKLLFSELVELAKKQDSVHLLRAELDHDLGISYLELELIDNNGQHRSAFNVETLRPLPLLKWY